jgi:hypothetical protein
MRLHYDAICGITTENKMSGTWFVYHVIRYNEDVLYVGKKYGQPNQGETFNITDISPRVVEIMEQDLKENKPYFMIGIIAEGLTEDEANEVMAESL